MRDKIPQYKTDYIVSWDVSDKDLPCIALTKMVRNEKGIVEAEHLGVSFDTSGSFSLLQAIEEHESRKRKQAERDRNASDLAKKFHVPKDDQKEEQSSDQGKTQSL